MRHSHSSCSDSECFKGYFLETKQQQLCQNSSELEVECDYFDFAFLTFSTKCSMRFKKQIGIHNEFKKCCFHSTIFVLRLIAKTMQSIS